MEKILLLDFNDNITLQEIYEELKYYHNQQMIVETTYKGITLNNQDMDKLKDIISRLELNLNEEEYQLYKNHELKNKEQAKLFFTRINTPPIVRYWIEKTKIVIETTKQEEWEKACYLLVQTSNERKNADVKECAIKYVYQTIISAAKIIISLQKKGDNMKLEEISKVIDNELSYSDDITLMDNKYHTLDTLITSFTNQGELYRRLTFYNEVTDNKKYSKPIENPITKKRIPDYLKIKY